MNGASGLSAVTGGVTAARGYLAGGVACGIKKVPNTLDLGIVLSTRPAAAAALFTRNRAAAAPVLLCRERIRARRARAVVVNSGNANACTGPQGMQDALAMGRLVAERFDLPEEEVLVLSTGVIGVPLPMERIGEGIARCAVNEQGGPSFASAILTTDTGVKTAAVAFDHAGHSVHVGGVAKGSGMIHPNMATMLAVLTTDAEVEPAFLQEALARATERSFNAISVDGDSSTNDTILLLANGAAGGTPITHIDAQASLFQEALNQVCTELAKAVVRDGEGARTLIEVRIEGASSDADAARIARAITVSPLVKAAVFGGDPNWGRVICAAGNAEVPFEAERATLSLNDICLLDHGTVVQYDRDRASRVLKESTVTFTLDLGLGHGTATAWGCDLSYEYVRINAEYTT
jgi:glutamate N-acetyltransferase/amino-acid N-acetyltransferase